MKARPSISQAEAFIARLTAEERLVVEHKSGQCCACYFTGAGICNHLAEQAAERRLMATKIDATPILRHAMDRAIDPRDTPENFSPIEIRLLDAFWSRGLDPETQYPIGPYTTDFAFPDSMLIVEADGYDYHQDYAREKRRDGYLKRQGWIVRHFQGWQIYEDADYCVMSVYNIARQS